jgi:hypothetical protein
MSNLVIDLTAATLPAGITLPEGATHTEGVGVTLPQGTSVDVNVPGLSNGGAYDITVTLVDPTPLGTFKIHTHIDDSIKYFASFKHGQYSNGIMYTLNPYQTNIASTTTGWNSTLQTSNEVRMFITASGTMRCFANGNETCTAEDVNYVASQDPNHLQLSATDTDFTITQIKASSFVDSLSTTEYELGATVTFTGGPFGATKSTSDLFLEVGGVLYDQTPYIDSWQDTSVVFNTNDPHIPYGRDLRFVLDSNLGSVGENTITVTPISTRNFIDILDPVFTSYSIFENAAGDTPTTGFQIDWFKEGGLTYTATGMVEYSGNSSSIVSSLRVYSTVDNTWSSSASITINAAEAPSTSLGQVDVLEVSEGGGVFRLSPGVASGTLYAVLTTTPRKPSKDALVLGVNYHNETPEWSEIRVVTNGDEDFSIVGLPKGSYNFYAVYEDASGVFTNIVDAQVDVLGALVPPVISAQPQAGTIQASVPESVHLLNVSATPLNKILWQHSKSGQGYVDIPEATDTDFSVSGLDYLTADSPLKFRAKLTGGGGAIVYTNEVTVTIQERPLVGISTVGVPDGTYKATLFNPYTLEFGVDVEVVVGNGTASVIPLSNVRSGDRLIGVLTKDSDSSYATPIEVVVS